ncbi:nucleolar complex protein 14, partial [Coemansia sp. RSA 2603]
MVAHSISAGKGQKQSALKKLRTALSSAGLTGPKSQVSKKDKKRGVRKASNIKTAERRQKLRQIQSALNPFEMKVNRKKLDVLGLKRKDDEVNVAVARQRALEKRKTTIGEERRMRHRLGGVVDRRIGENDPTMDPEEKMLRRFTAERQKRGASMFNIEDSDVEGEITALTHYGQAIDDMDDLDLQGSDDADDDGVISGRDVETTHFGGFEQASEADGGRKKTKAEVMQELIAKSKKHKQERQLAKEQDEDLRRELDGDFEDVRALLFADDAEKPMMKAADTGATPETRESADRAYDAVVRELVFEQRARPQDRLKTEEEQAREEMERLERAERHRRRRMDGLDSDTERESDDDDDQEMRAYKTESKRRPVADDLGDDFAPADSDNEGTAGVSLGAGLQVAESEEDVEEDDDDESEDESDDESGDEEDDESEEEEDGSADEVEDQEDQTKFKTRVSQASASTAAASSDELPYTFPAPADYDAWVELVGNYSLDQQLVVIRRLRTLYHIRLSPQNKQKLSDLCLILTEHLAVLAEQDPPVPGAVIDELVKHIGELAPVDGERFGEHCRQSVVDCHRRIQQAIRASGTDTATTTDGLRASDVALMRMFASVFSSSDRYHPV